MRTPASSSRRAQAHRPSRCVHRLATPLAGLLLLLGGAPAEAGGSTMHLAQASRALELLAETDPDLHARISAHLVDYLNGTNFPDVFNPPNVGIQAALEELGLSTLFSNARFFYSTEQSHSAWFLTHYAAYVRQHHNDGNLDDAVLAHFMGTLAHVIGDWRFDRYFVPTVTRQCFPHNLPGGFAQVWTDQHMDWLLAPLRNDPGASGILSPGSSTLPYAVGHASDLTGSDPSILELAYPGSLAIPYPILQLAADVAFLYVDNEPLLAPFAVGGCDLALDAQLEGLWDTGIGGRADSGRAIATAMSTTWQILLSGGRPEFDEYSSGYYGYCVDFIVTDATGGPLDQIDVTSWIPGPEDVTRMQLEGNRIAALQETGTGQTRLLILDGDVNETWDLAFETAREVLAFQLEGERTAVLLDDGELLVRDGPAAPWNELAQGVSDFRLEGDRLAVLATRPNAPAPMTTRRGRVGPAPSPGSEPIRTAQPAGNVLRVRDLASPGSWIELSGAGEQVMGFELSGDRIGLHTREFVHGLQVERLVVREDVLGAGTPWNEVWSRARNPGASPELTFDIHGDRIAWLVDGELSVLEGVPGTPEATLAVVAQNVARFQLTGDHVALLGDDQMLSVQTGPLEDPPVDIHADVASFELLDATTYYPQKPWLGYTLLDGTVMANRNFASPDSQGPRDDHIKASPVFGVAASDFELAVTPQFIDGNRELWYPDRLAVLTENRLYFQELPPTLDPDPDESGTAPTTAIVEMVPYDGVLSTWVQLNWQVPNPAASDFVALYYDDPHEVGATQYIVGQWQSATAGSSWVSSLKWKPGYFIAYIHEDDLGAYHIVDSAGPIQAGVQLLGTFFDDAYPFTDYVALGWTVQEINGASTAGVNDFVALYTSDPSVEGFDANTYLDGQWEWATSTSPGTTSTPWAAGYWVGYVEENHSGERSVAWSEGPTTVDDVDVNASIYPGLTGNYVQLNWTVTHPGDSDYVALYLDEPTNATAGNFIPGQFQWANRTSTSWASDVIWRDGYWVGYVQIDALGQATVRDTFETTWCSTPPTATVWPSYYDGFFFDYVQLNWTVSNAGPNDFVALYSSYPTQATVDDYLAGQWQWATSGTFWVSNTIYLPGYWVGYVHVDSCGNHVLVDVSDTSS
jgi:hypothetical protein